MAIHIYYRHTPIQRSSGKFRPEWFSHKKCFLNLLETIHSSLLDGKVHLHLVFDGSENDLRQDFAIGHLDRLAQGSPSAEPAIHRHMIIGGNQRKAWRAVVALAKAHCDDNTVQPNDIIYFLENDYVHRAGWIDEVNQLKAHGICWDYLTLYDHPDKYPDFCKHGDTRHYRNLRSQIFVTPKRHWRTTPSTCATYMLSREAFMRDQLLLRFGIFDFRLFGLLTKILRRRLLSPLPALSTHSMSDFLSPNVDWAKELAKHSDE
ncbi:MAG: glycosyl transferase [Betaproteobacteria bacterium]|nr:glycosyl transferase [Betaproteobacteria bacterium]